MSVGDQISVGKIQGDGIAIGRGARVEINRNYTEIIIRPDSFEDLPPAPGEEPYKGLVFFREADAANFYGREELSAEIVARMQNTRFLAVIGASGSGKSSLIRAGVVPRLRKRNWQVIVMTPSARPLQRLASALTYANSGLALTDDLQAEFVDSSRTLLLAANKLAASESSAHLLLAIDQFEELFTLCKDKNERRSFVDNLLAGVGDEGALSLLVGLRADYYGHAARYDGLRDLIVKEQTLIGPMRQRDLVRAILEPAKRGGWQFVEGLAEQILEDAGHEPGRLPLVSHALLETWEQRRGTVMTLGGYRVAGGVEGAIAKTAENTLQRLDGQQSAVVKHIFLTLTELGEGANDARRSAALDELMLINADNEVINRTIEELVRARLIIIDGDQVEVAHEALIRRWPRLHSWIDEDRERLSFNRRLARAASEWEANGRNPDFLFRGSQLRQAELRINEYKPWQPSEKQTDFIDASRQVDALEALEDEMVEAEGQQDALRSTSFAIVGGVIGLGLSGLLLFLSEYFRESATFPSPVFAGLYTIIAVVAGGVVGFLYVPFSDWIGAATLKQNSRLSPAAKVITATIAFMLAASALLFLAGDKWLLIWFAGGIWGLVAGSGRLWIKRSKRPRMLTIPLTGVLSGTAFAGTYAISLYIGISRMTFSLWPVLGAGIWTPLAILSGDQLAQIIGGERKK